MRNLLHIIGIFAVCGAAMTAGVLINTPAALAQNYNRNLEAISNLNRIDPQQNPSYESSAKALDRHVLDRKNKVVGEVDDIILKDNGNIELLNVDFDRLRLGSLSLNFRSMGIAPVSNAYALNLDSDQVENIYPSLLAETQTAAGAADDIFSVKRLIGGSVKSTGGQAIGTISDVLFTSSGQRASAILISLSRNNKVAIPFNRPAFEDGANNRKNIILDEDMASALKDYAKAR